MNDIINEVLKRTKLENFYKLLQNKNYELIYQYYGKNVYQFFTPKLYQKEDIKKLMIEKRYGEIYSKYGFSQIVKIKNLRKYKFDDIKKLKESGRYEDIYIKYGEKEYNRYLDIMREADIKNELPDISKFKLYKSKFKLVSKIEFLKKISTATIASCMFICGFVGFNNGLEFKQNEISYYDAVMEYNSKIHSYANEVNEMNLSDLQIIMKVMNDIWQEMEGYGKPELDIRGFERIDLLNENGVGVCRNIADDFTAKMNAINPSYNARNVIVYFDNDCYNKESMANIAQKYSKSYLEMLENNSENNQENIENEDDLFKKQMGNHMVTVLDIPEDNISLIVDATNPSIGYLKQGKIYMLSNYYGKGLEFANLGQVFFNDTKNYLSIEFEKVNSAFKFNDLNDINKKYGHDAQNEALLYVRDLDIKNKNR